MKNQKEKQVEEKNSELKDKIEDIKKNLEEKSQDIKKELKRKAKDIKEDIQEKTEDIKDKTEELLKDIADNTKKFDKKDIQENKAMACLAYILPPIPYFIGTKSKWVKYHAIQGMNLFIIFIILTLAVTVINKLILGPFTFIQTILRTTLNVFTVIYAIVGIINACNGEAKELPIINKFKFIKK